MPPPKDASQASSVTLRLKHSTHTTLLAADPSQPVGSIATDLLEALHEVYPDRRLPSGALIPESVDDVLLGTPNDINDLEKGGYTLVWAGDSGVNLGGIEGDEDNDGGEDEEQTPKRKGRGDTSNKGGKGAEKSITIAEAGIRSGGVVAYKFRSGDQGGGDEWVVKVPRYEDEE